MQPCLSGLSPEAMRQLIFGSPEKPIFTLANYAVPRELGRGGCGAVYLATPKSGGDPVAVKLMLIHARRSITPSMSIRFLRLLDQGSGDYTATRQSQPDEGTMEDLCAEIRAFEANTPKP